MPRKRKIEILSVEDSEPDREMLRIIFQSFATPHRLHFAYDGTEARQFLLREGEYRESPYPDLILVDLNMPRMDGRQLLKFIKAHPRLKTLPVIVCSTSNHRLDIAESYELGACAFLGKSPDLLQFQDTVRSLEDFWLRSVTYPPPPTELFA